MDSFEINKIVAAILMVALLLIGIGKMSDVIFHVEKPETPGYTVEIEQVLASSTNSVSEIKEEKINIAALMAMGDLATGEKVFKNVQRVTQLSKVEKIILDLLCIMWSIEKLGQ